MLSKFSIKDLERLSGIKAHTIRIWEQRYNLLQPERTGTNIRSYSNEDLRLLMNVSLLNNHGIKISKIASLSLGKIFEEAAGILQSNPSGHEQMHSLIMSMIGFDEALFNQTLEQAITQKGFSETILQIVFPFLEKTGMMWQTGTINSAQEHFAANLIRQKLIAAIHAQKHFRRPDDKRIVLFLPDGELHELTLLFCHYLLKDKGHTVFYLGPSLPFEDLKEAIGSLKPDVVQSIITSPFRNQSLTEFLAELRQSFPGLPFIISGYQIARHGLRSQGQFQLFSDTATLAEHLQRM